MIDVLSNVASAQRERASKTFFDTAAASVSAELLDVIGTPESMLLINKLGQSMQVNFQNWPAILVELNRTFKKYGAKTVKAIEKEQAEYEAEQNGDEYEEPAPKESYEIDDGEVYANEDE